MSDETTHCPLPSRRQLKEQGSSASTPKKVVMRSLLLASLAALTVASPLTGILDPEKSIALPVREIGTPVGGVTWVNASATLAEADSLGADLAAASRARVRAPVTVDACVPSATAASGGRQIVQADVIYWPLPAGSYQYTSPFGMRLHPVLGTYKMHEGIDLSAPLGTPLYSVADGVVAEINEYSGTGAYVKIRHTAVDGSTYFSLYLHQYMNEITVSVGQEVHAGQIIGAVGNNGWSTGPHLHFEIRDIADTPRDPMTWLLENSAIHLGQEC